MREGEKYLCVIRGVTGDPPETLVHLPGKPVIFKKKIKLSFILYQAVFLCPGTPGTGSPKLILA